MEQKTNEYATCPPLDPLSPPQYGGLYIQKYFVLAVPYSKGG